MSQGFLSRLAFGPRGVRWLLNLWPPFRGMGVTVRDIAPDFRRARVEPRMRLLNRNCVGTHFGGRFEPTYAVDLKDGEGTVVATVEKTLYIRKKK